MLKLFHARKAECWFSEPSSGRYGILPLKRPPVWRTGAYQFNLRSDRHPMG